MQSWPKDLTQLAVPKFMHLGVVVFFEDQFLFGLYLPHVLM